MTVTHRADFLLGDEGAGLTSSISGTIPGTAQAGDLALLSVVQATGVNTFPDPAGWTRLRTVEDSINTNLTTQVWAKKLVAGDLGATVTVTSTGGGGARFVGVGDVFSGVGSIADIIVTKGQHTSAVASLTSPAITTVEDDCGIVTFWAVRANSTTPPSVAAPGTHTADGQSNTANAVAPNFAIRATHRTTNATTPGAYGAVTASVAPNSTSIMYSVALPPSAGLVVDAGADQADVEPWTTVTLTGAATGGPVVSESWSQTGGTTVTLATPTAGLGLAPFGTSGFGGVEESGSSRTFTAPGTIAGDTLTFDYSATNSDGATTTDTMTVTVLPVTERAAVAGAWVPLRLEELVAPAAPPDPESIALSVAKVGHDWTMWSRTPTYGLDLALPIISAKFVRKHMDVSTAICETPFTPERWVSLQPSCGVVLYRDGKQEFTGRNTARQLEWDAENGRAIIHVEAQGGALDLRDRLVFPDPLRADDDQTVNDYWTRSGVPASTAMLALISDQAGPTCRSSRRVPGLTLGDDPGVGVVRTWKALFLPLLEQLQVMSVQSGANLGVRVVSESGGLEASIYKPRDLSGSVKFSADLSNLVGFTYREEAPTVTDAVAAGQGDLHLRLREKAVTSSALALTWGRRIWSYIDRRDTADAAELTQSATDAVNEGDVTVSLAVRLTDSQAATYSRDWGLGDRITVYVGLPGQTKVATVSDVVREVLFEVSEDGAERITPAIGSFDAKAVIPTPTQRQLAVVGTSLGGLIARK